jgi:hypothetical protein
MKISIASLLFFISRFICNAQSISNVIQNNTGTIITYRSDGSEISRMEFDKVQSKLAGFNDNFLVVEQGFSVLSFDQNFKRIGFFNMGVGQYVKYVKYDAIGLKYETEGEYLEGDDNVVVWWTKDGLQIGVSIDE